MEGPPPQELLVLGAIDRREVGDVDVAVEAEAHRRGGGRRPARRRRRWSRGRARGRRQLQLDPSVDRHRAIGDHQVHLIGEVRLQWRDLEAAQIELEIRRHRREPGGARQRQAAALVDPELDVEGPAGTGGGPEPGGLDGDGRDDEGRLGLDQAILEAGAPVGDSQPPELDVPGRGALVGLGWRARAASARAGLSRGAGSGRRGRWDQLRQIDDPRLVALRRDPATVGGDLRHRRLVARRVDLDPAERELLDREEVVVGPRAAQPQRRDLDEGIGHLHRRRASGAAGAEVVPGAEADAPFANIEGDAFSVVRREAGGLDSFELDGAARGERLERESPLVREHPARHRAKAERHRGGPGPPDVREALHRGGQIFDAQVEGRVNSLVARVQRRILQRDDPDLEAWRGRVRRGGGAAQGGRGGRPGARRSLPRRNDLGRRRPWRGRQLLEVERAVRQPARMHLEPIEPDAIDLESLRQQVRAPHHHLELAERKERGRALFPGHHLLQGHPALRRQTGRLGGWSHERHVDVHREQGRAELEAQGHRDVPEVAGEVELVDAQLEGGLEGVLEGLAAPEHGERGAVDAQVQTGLDEGVDEGWQGRDEGDPELEPGDLVGAAERPIVEGELAVGDVNVVDREAGGRSALRRRRWLGLPGRRRQAREDVGEVVSVGIGPRGRRGGQPHQVNPRGFEANLAHHRGAPVDRRQLGVHVQAVKSHEGRPPIGLEDLEILDGERQRERVGAHASHRHAPAKHGPELGLRDVLHDGGHDEEADDRDHRGRDHRHDPQATQPAPAAAGRLRRAVRGRDRGLQAVLHPNVLADAHADDVTSLSYRRSRRATRRRTSRPPDRPRPRPAARRVPQPNSTERMDKEPRSNPLIGKLTGPRPSAAPTV